MKTRTFDLKALYPDALKDAPETLITEYVADVSSEIKDAPRPVMIVFPGGGYRFCSDRENEPVCLEYLAKGFHVFALKYAIRGYAYPVQLLQACATIRYIRTHAKELNIDPQKISVVGFSAGGHCAAMFATMANEPVVLNAFGAKKGDLVPNAAVLCYAVLVNRYGHKVTYDEISGGDDELREYLSLEQRVTPDTPPCYIFHTFSDEAVDVRNSLYFAAALKENGVSAQIRIAENGPHGVSLADDRVASNNAGWKDKPHFDFPECKGWLEESVEFLRRHKLWL